MNDQKYREAIFEDLLGEKGIEYLRKEYLGEVTEDFDDLEKGEEICQGPIRVCGIGNGLCIMHDEEKLKAIDEYTRRKKVDEKTQNDNEWGEK